MRKTFGFTMAATAVLALVVVLAAPATAQAADQPMHPSGVLMPLKVGASPVLRDMDLNALRRQQAPTKAQEINPREVNAHNAELPGRIANAPAPNRPVDAAVQGGFGPLVMPAAIMNFDGVGNVDGVLPPDTEGDVGVNYYVQWVNLSFDIFDKTTGVSAIGGPVPGNSLWTGFGGSCETNNSGDPIVLYDHLAGRWFMSQFTSDNHQCIAVSQTGDPTGAWWLYDYVADAGMGDFPDYPKFGVWPDGYYYSANMFGDGSSMTGVFERDQMLNGNPAQFVWFYTPDTAALPSFSQLPADLDGTNLPPAGAPNPFVELVDDAWGYDPPYDTDGIVVTPLHVDWATPGNSTFGPPTMVAVPPFDSNLCGYDRNCIPQPGTAQGLDALSSRLMYRLQYRNFGSYQTLITSHTVDTDGADHAGVRWYELRDSGGGWTVNQADTYAPDSDHRWMGDAAMDASGDIAVGYSVSSSTTYPSVRWAGRLAGDPADTLAQGEDTVIAGSGSQTHSAARWGDYSSMSVDPTDDCTFWYTQEYMPTTGSAPWQTRIASFKFPSCTTGPTGTVQGTVTNSATTDPIEGATVQVGGFSTTTNASGFYTITVPVDTYDVTASKFGFTPQTVTGIDVTDGGTVTQDFALDPAGKASFDGYVTDAGHGWPLYAKVELKLGPTPVATTFTNPFNGYYEIELPQGMNYDFTVTPVAPGYNPMTRTALLPPAGATEGFAFTPISPACTAPGYGPASGSVLDEAFEGAFPPAGWTVTPDGATGGAWESTTTTGRGNFTGGAGDAADADSDWFGTGMTTTLTSPVMDVSAATTLTFEFKYDFNDFNGSDQGSVDVSNDGGATWTTVKSWAFADDRGPKTFTMDATALLGGSTQAQVRFTYDAPGWDWWFEVDDVKLFDPSAPCTPVPGAMMAGFVTDANTTDAINGADVVGDLGDGATTMATPDDPAIGDGFYSFFAPLPGLGAPNGPSTRTFTASAPKYADKVVTMNPAPDAVNQLDFALDAGWLEVTPTHLESRLYSGQTEDQPLDIINHGTIDANVTLLASETAGWVPTMPMDQIPAPTAAPEHLNDRNARAANVPEREREPTAALAAGDVISSFPTGLTFPWGGTFDTFDTTVWTSNIGASGGDDLDYEFTSAGSATGRTVDTSSWIGSWAGDMAFDPTTGMIWQVNVGGDNCIYELDPASGPTGNSICWGATTSERGLAYDPVSDTFFVGGWNSLAITRFDRTGTVLQVANVGLSIAGLAYNPVSQHLFVLENSPTDTVTVLDVANNYSVIGTFTIAGFGNYAGAGLGISCDGHLWAVNQGNQSIYEVDSGESGACMSASLPWLTLTPDNGLVPGNEGNLPIDAQFIADGADHFGLYRANIKVIHDTPYTVNDVSVCFTKAFHDIAPGFWADAYVHSLAGARISQGCGAGNFCPTDLMTRGVMARWLVKAYHGADFKPIPCAGTFADVICESTPNSDYIEQLYADGITTGCQAGPPLLYCPDAPVTRAQMAAFITRAKYGPSFVPPAPTGTVFTDVGPGQPGWWAGGYIEWLYNEGVIDGFGDGTFHPVEDTHRGQMSKMIVNAFNLPMCVTP